MHVISVPWLGITPISEGLVLDTLLPKELIRIMVCIQGSNPCLNGSLSSVFITVKMNDQRITINIVDL